MFLKAAINGTRSRDEHPTVPLTASEIAEVAAAAQAAGADVVHAHATKPDGSGSIEPEHVAAMVRAVRERDDRVIIGTTTGLWTVSGHEERMRLLEAWPEDALPDFASVAFCEEGADETAVAVIAKGMVLESAVWARADVPALLASRTLHQNVRVLIEPEDEDPEVAVRECRAIAAMLRDGGVTCSLLYHGYDQTAWPVMRAAIEDGVQGRIGLEDVLTLPDGSQADNVEMIHAVREMAGA